MKIRGLSIHFEQHGEGNPIEDRPQAIWTDCAAMIYRRLHDR